MAYDKKELEKLAIEAIEEHELVFVEEIVAFLPCSKSTFYELKLNESDILKDAILKVKIKQKAQMRKDWKDSAPVLQLSRYKLLASEEELRRLSVTKNEHSGDQGKPMEFTVQVLGNDEPILEEPKDDEG